MVLVAVDRTRENKKDGGEAGEAGQPEAAFEAEDPQYDANGTQGPESQNGSTVLFHEWYPFVKGCRKLNSGELRSQTEMIILYHTSYTFTI